MSEPTRYRVANNQAQLTLGGGILVVDPDGPLVEYADYARLKAVVERLTFDPLTYLDDNGEWMPRHIHLAAVERLKAEVERLRKAGDWMYNAVVLNSDMEMDKAMDAWNAAKEGKQS